MNKFLITGASSGIGREVAIRLAKRGAKLTLSGRSEAKLNEVAAIFACRVHVGRRADGGRVHSKTCQLIGTHREHVGDRRWPSGF